MCVCVQYIWNGRVTTSFLGLLEVFKKKEFETAHQEGPADLYKCLITMLEELHLPNNNVIDFATDGSNTKNNLRKAQKNKANMKNSK